jgi:hypothetical protein
LATRSPGCGLLSIGSEDAKGLPDQGRLQSSFPKPPINFVGNIEGRDLFERPVEVVVCDGFVGNVVLKTGESIATAIFHWLAHEIKNPVADAGALAGHGNAFRAIEKKTNYEEYGGSLLLGVNGDHRHRPRQFYREGDPQRHPRSGGGRGTRGQRPDHPRRRDRRRPQGSQSRCRRSLIPA